MKWMEIFSSLSSACQVAKATSRFNGVRYTRASFKRSTPLRGLRRFEVRGSYRFEVRCLRAIAARGVKEVH
jgi:hypothetical protein